MSNNEQIIVEETGLIFEETLIERVNNRDVSPLSLIFIIARVLPYFMFSHEGVW